MVLLLWTDSAAPRYCHRRCRCCCCCCCCCAKNPIERETAVLELESTTPEKAEAEAFEHLRLEDLGLRADSNIHSD